MKRPTWPRSLPKPSRTGVVLVAIAVVVLFVFLYVLPGLLVTGGLSPAQRARAVAEERRTVLALFVGIGGAISLYYTHKRHQLESDSNATGRYTTAVEQLAHSALAVRLGGLFALERIARDSPRDRQAIAEVMAAYIRGGGIRGDSADGLGPAGDDVVAAARILAYRKTHGWPTARRLDLSGANLTGANISAPDFRRDNLQRVDFIDAYLPKAQFDDSQLTDVSFGRAILTGASFQGAKLTNADFTAANLENADFSATFMANAKFKGANTTGATFPEAYKHLLDP